MDAPEFSVPVIVAGGGACGAVAALAVKAAGAEVLVVEQDATPLGSTAMSQGLICAAGTRAQRAAGVEDDSDLYFADIMAKTRGQTDPALARLIADNAGPALDWLMDAHGLPFELDTRFRPAYGLTRARVHGWSGRGGGDLIAFLHKRLGECEVDVLLRARLVDLIADDDGRVEAVVLERPGGEVERIGCDALVLATSGFGGNTKMVSEHMPELRQARYHGHEGNIGYGITLAQQLGAAVGDMGSYQGYGMLTDAGLSLPPPHMIEGGLLLNAQGRRFVDEAEDIAGMIHPVLAQPGGFAWAVYDAQIEARCLHIPETRELVAHNAAKTADSDEALASAIGAPVDAVASALADANAAAREGRCDATGRAWTTAQPPSAPFRTIRVTGALYHTQGGLKVDGEARVVREDGSPLPNLFAGGGAARSVSGPSYWGYLPAMGLCTAVTLGRIAGENAARLVLGRSAA